MDSFLIQYGLRERPFEAVTDPNFYFASKEHREALARLSYLVDQETMYFGMLTGEIGGGKSITRRFFTSRIDTTKHCVVEFENSHFPTSDLIRRLLVKAGASPKVSSETSLGQLFEQVAALTTELHDVEGRQLVLVFDEAQDLSSEALLDLKRLSNLNGEIPGNLTIILIGQPELRQQLENLPPLDQRISLRFHLLNLGIDEVGPYVEHRLRIAGHPTGQLFVPETYDQLYRASRGVPREINRIAKLSLENAYASKTQLVVPEHIASVLHDLRRHQSMPSPPAFSG
jgi:general secretion pathway protein A